MHKQVIIVTEDAVNIEDTTQYLKNTFPGLKILARIDNNSITVKNCTETIAEKIQDTLSSISPTHLRTWMYEMPFGWKIGYYSPHF